MFLGLFKIALIGLTFLLFLIILGEHLGITSATDKSSTNLILNNQLSTKGLTSIATSNGPSFVPWGIPPLTFLFSDVTLFILTHCMRLVRKDFTHLTKAGWLSRRAISEHKTYMVNKVKSLLEIGKGSTYRAMSSIKCLHDVMEKGHQGLSCGMTFRSPKSSVQVRQRISTVYYLKKWI